MNTQTPYKRIEIQGIDGAIGVCDYQVGEQSNDDGFIYILLRQPDIKPYQQQGYSVTDLGMQIEEYANIIYENEIPDGIPPEKLVFIEYSPQETFKFFKHYLPLIYENHWFWSGLKKIFKINLKFLCFDDSPHAVSTVRDERKIRIILSNQKILLA